MGNNPRLGTPAESVELPPPVGRPSSAGYTGTGSFDPKEYLKALDAASSPRPKPASTTPTSPANVRSAPAGASSPHSAVVYIGGKEFVPGSQAPPLPLLPGGALQRPKLRAIPSLMPSRHTSSSFRADADEDDEDNDFLNFLATRKRRNLEVEDRRLCFGLITAYRWNIIKSMVTTAIEIFKVVMACMLTVVVPQSCTDSSGISQQCSFTQTLTGLTQFQELALGLNFAVLGITLLHYTVVFLRERVLIRFLDEERTSPVHNLPKLIKDYPEIETIIRRKNFQVFISALITFCGHVANIIVSAFALFTPTRFNGYRSATTFATNSVLLIYVLQRTLYNCWVGIWQGYALSCVELEPVTYNQIDVQYRRSEEELKRLRSGMPDNV